MKGGLYSVIESVDSLFERETEVIVIEGPDGAGKTTLVNDLVDEYTWADVGRRGTTNRDELYRYTVVDTRRAFTKAMFGTTPPVIWDRLYYSELVYYPYTTGKCAFNEVQREYYEGLFKAMRIPVILCMPPVETVVENVQREDRHEMDEVKENIVSIYEGYEDLLYSRRLSSNTLIFDYTKGPSEYLKITEFIDAYLNYRQERCRS